jgi:flagellin
MPTSAATLTVESQSALTALRETSKAQDVASKRLSSGKKVDSAADNAVNYAISRQLTDKAGDLALVSDSVQQGLSAINAALDGASAVESITNQLKSVALQGNQTTDAAARADLATQYNSLRSQLDSVVQDASYNGVNLLSSTSSDLTIRTGRALSDNTTISAVDSTAASLGLAAIAADGSDFSSALASQIDNAAGSIRATAQSLGSRATELTIRADSARAQVANLLSGADKLTAADTNAEAATALALRTRRQLSAHALSIANKNQQSVLSLFK